MAQQQQIYNYNYMPPMFPVPPIPPRPLSNPLFPPVLPFFQQVAPHTQQATPPTQVQPEELTQEQELEEQTRVFQPISGASNHHCAPCLALMRQRKQIQRRIAACHICHHYAGASCHEGGICSLIPGKDCCDDLAICPTGWDKLHKTQDAGRNRDVKNDHHLSKHFSTETKGLNVSETSQSLQVVLRQIAESPTEVRESAKEKALRWKEKTFGGSVENVKNATPKDVHEEKTAVIEDNKEDDTNGFLRKGKRKKENKDPYDLTKTEIEENIATAKDQEESARKRRRLFERMLADFDS